MGCGPGVSLCYNRSRLARSTAYHYYSLSSALHSQNRQKSRHGTTKWGESQTKTMATLWLTQYSTRDFSTPAGQLGQRHIIISQRHGLVTCSQTRHRCVAGASLPARRGGMRSLIIRLGCPPRRAVGSASFRDDAWILWEITRPRVSSGLSLLLTSFA